jgi:hypothetical protein
MKSDETVSSGHEVLFHTRTDLNYAVRTEHCGSLHPKPHFIIHLNVTLPHSQVSHLVSSFQYFRLKLCKHFSPIPWVLLKFWSKPLSRP